MYYLRSLGAREPSSPISPSDIGFLREQLESLADGASSFYVDQATVEMMYTLGATAELLAALTDAVRDGGEAELEIVEGRAGGGLSPLHFEASDDHEASMRAVGADIDPRELASVEESPSDTDAAIERAFAEAPAVSGPTRLINGQPLTCAICGEKSFTRRTAQLHSAAATFFGFEWTGPSAECYICTSCGYVHWFMN